MVLKKSDLNEIDMSIGKRLRACRLMHGLTQHEIAEKAGITFQQIQKYERGLNRISGSRIYQLCMALDIDPNYLFEDFSQTSKSQLLDQDELTDDKQIISLVKSYNKIKSPELKATVREIAQILANTPQ